MNTLTKSILAISGLIIAGAVFYFLVFFLPQNRRTQDDHFVANQREQCAKAGTSYGKELEKQQNESVVYDVQVYAYSERLGTCVIRYNRSFFASEHSIPETNAHIDDVYTHSTLYRYQKNAPTTGGEFRKALYGDEAEFKEYEQEFFGQTYW